MTTYSFKSVGKTVSQQESETLTTSVLPLGIKVPLRYGAADSVFEMHTVMSDQVHDNLKALIQTNWGERLCLYDYGANLQPLTSEFSNIEDFNESAMQRIRDAVNKWMPYILQR
jgi:hypothetical protein